MVVIGDENSDINIGENDKLEWGKSCFYSQYMKSKYRKSSGQRQKCSSTLKQFLDFCHNYLGQNETQYVAFIWITCYSCY